MREYYILFKSERTKFYCWDYYWSRLVEIFFNGVIVKSWKKSHVFFAFDWARGQNMVSQILKMMTKLFPQSGSLKM